MPSLTNGTQFTDTGGSPVHAHGGGILQAGGYFYWFGEDRHPDDTFRSVSVYRSPDLVRWEHRGAALRPAAAAELGTANIERPKVLFNEATGRFVMWAHKEEAGHYREARAAVAVCDTPDGEYRYRGSLRPLGHMSRDLTLFSDEDGTGYLISAANDNADLHVYRLTEDYTEIAELVAVLWPGQFREAPALFRREGVYFLLTSGCTNWAPNQQRYATAPEVAGPWTEPVDVGDATTFDSQTAYVQPVHGREQTSYLYLGDRWAANWQRPVNESAYVWLPLRFPSPTTMTLGWQERLEIDAASGEVR
jgi:beta-xylosidase